MHGHLHASHLPHAGAHVPDFIAYLRFGIYAEFFVLGLYWVGLFVFALALSADVVLFSLIVPALHFVAPFAVLEVLNFFEDKWLSKPRVPLRYEIWRWLAQCVVTLMSDIVALTVGIRVHYPELVTEGLRSYGVAYIVFHVLLLVSTLLLTIALVATQSSMNHYSRAHKGGKTDAEDARLLQGIRDVYLPHDEQK